MRTCPICKVPVASSDMRSINVFCPGVAVQERVPLMEEVDFFLEVQPDHNYLAYTRTYPNGMRDEFEHESLDNGQARVTRSQHPVAGIRLMERSMHSTPCCRNCRESFIAMLTTWSKGGQDG
jgi:hypothetical protein